MIKYKEQPYDEFFRNMEDGYYKGKNLSLSEGLITILDGYFRWLIPMFRGNRNNPHGKIRVLEPGSRMGEAGITLKRLYGNEVEYVGMELSTEVIEQSKKFHDYNIHGDICDYQNPWIESFDIVFCRTLMGFLGNVGEAIGGMLRMLLKGGWLVIIQPIPYPIGTLHYNSADSMGDFLNFIDSSMVWRLYEKIPVLDERGESIFGEPILIVEK